MRLYVSEFGADVFSTDGLVLFCKVCEVKVAADKKYTIQQHITRDKHLRGIQKRNEQTTSLTQPMYSEYGNSNFNLDLCRAFLSANIPLHKLSHPILRNFLENYTNKTIPDSSTLRQNYVNKCYEETMNKIRTYASGKKIWISIDETSDAAGRYVANAIIGTLEIDHPGKTFLLNSECLEKANHGTIARFFDKSLLLLWPDGVKRENVLLFVTDAAPYMVKAARSLKLLYANMEHVTCLAHALHRVSEEIRKYFPLVDEFISNMKKVFLKAPSRTLIFKTFAPNIPLPPNPVITKWGTWINASLYYCEHLSSIKNVLRELSREEATAIAKVQDLIDNQTLKCNLIYIKTNFSSLPESINRLETSDLSLKDSIKIVVDFRQKIQQSKNEIGIAIQNKLKMVLEKNTGFETLSKISKIIDGNESDTAHFPDEFNIDDITYMKFAPITSVDVERSFSCYKTLLADNRRSFVFENLKELLIVQCNNTI